MFGFGFGFGFLYLLLCLFVYGFMKYMGFTKMFPNDFINDCSVFKVHKYHWSHDVSGTRLDFTLNFTLNQLYASYGCIAVLNCTIIKIIEFNSRRPPSSLEYDKICDIPGTRTAAPPAKTAGLMAVV